MGATGMRGRTHVCGGLALVLAAALLGGCSRAEFDSARAFELLRRQCEFGPRPPGSAAHERTLRWIADTVGACADRVALQHFTVASTRGDIDLTNVIASFRPEARQRILLAAHWDTRAIADRETDPARSTEPILGANDGASGVAVLLELATLLAERRPRVGVDMVFFDGEDGGSGGGFPDWCMGSSYYAAHMGDYCPRLAVVVDMIGDRDLSILKEENSLAASPAAVERVWEAARQVGATSFKETVGTAIYDDHVPLIRAGVPAVLVIDLDYPFWHSLADTPDKCSQESLGEVGRAIAALVYSRRAPG
jgi:glutaminyl-peptide cyclotransferase